MLLHIWTCELFRKIYASQASLQVPNSNQLSHATSQKLQAVSKDQRPEPVVDGIAGDKPEDPKVANEDKSSTSAADGSVKKERMSDDLEALIRLSTVGIPVWDDTYFNDDNAENGSSMTSQYCGTTVPPGLAMAVAETSTVDGTTCGHDHSAPVETEAKMEMEMEQVTALAPPIERSVVEVAPAQTQESVHTFQSSEDSSMQQPTLEAATNSTLPAPQSPAPTATATKVPAATKAPKNKLALRKLKSTEGFQDFNPIVQADEKRKRRSTNHGRLSSAELMQMLSRKDINPHLLVSPHVYGEKDGAGAYQQQPFRILVHPQVGLVADIHARMCEAEVIGLLAGRWVEGVPGTDQGRGTIYVQCLFPCTSTQRYEDDGSTDVELSPAAELAAREVIHGLGLTVVGWYHSHPKFRPDPSVTDIMNQSSYQQLMRSSSDNKVDAKEEASALSLASAGTSSDAMEEVAEEETRSRTGSLSELHQSTSQESADTSGNHPENSHFHIDPAPSPFIGLIVSPYDAEKPEVDTALMRWFHTKTYQHLAKNQKSKIEREKDKDRAELPMLLDVIWRHVHRDAANRAAQSTGNTLGSEDLKELLLSKVVPADAADGGIVDQAPPVQPVFNASSSTCTPAPEAKPQPTAAKPPPPAKGNVKWKPQSSLPLAAYNYVPKTVTSKRTKSLDDAKKQREIGAALPLQAEEPAVDTQPGGPETEARAIQFGPLLSCQYCYNYSTKTKMSLASHQQHCLEARKIMGKPPRLTGEKKPASSSKKHPQVSKAGKFVKSSSRTSNQMDVKAPVEQTAVLGVATVEAVASGTAGLASQEAVAGQVADPQLQMYMQQHGGRNLPMPPMSAGGKGFISPNASLNSNMDGALRGGEMNFGQGQGQGQVEPAVDQTVALEAAVHEAAAVSTVQGTIVFDSLMPKAFHQAIETVAKAETTAAPEPEMESVVEESGMPGDLNFLSSLPEAFLMPAPPRREVEVEVERKVFTEQKDRLPEFRLISRGPAAGMPESDDPVQAKALACSKAMSISVSEDNAAEAENENEQAQTPSDGFPLLGLKGSGSPDYLQTSFFDSDPLNKEPRAPAEASGTSTGAVPVVEPSVEGSSISIGVVPPPIEGSVEASSTSSGLIDPNLVMNSTRAPSPAETLTASSSVAGSMDSMGQRASGRENKKRVLFSSEDMKSDQERIRDSKIKQEADPAIVDAAASAAVVAKKEIFTQKIKGNSGKFKAARQAPAPDSEEAAGVKRARTDGPDLGVASSAVGIEFGAAAQAPAPKVKGKKPVAKAVRPSRVKKPSACMLHTTAEKAIQQTNSGLSTPLGTTTLPLPAVPAPVPKRVGNNKPRVIHAKIAYSFIQHLGGSIDLRGAELAQDMLLSLPPHLVTFRGIFLSVACFGFYYAQHPRKVKLLAPTKIIKSKLTRLVKALHGWLLLLGMADEEAQHATKAISDLYTHLWTKYSGSVEAAPGSVEAAADPVASAVVEQGL